MPATVAETAGALPPRANPELIGHAAAERALADAYASGRLAHAWLIAGPRGIGKATLAFRFARWLLAGGAAGEGPGLFGAPAPSSDLAVPAEDPVFRLVASGGHPDLLTVERSVDEKSERLRTEITVADVRAVGGFLRLTPAMGGWRIVVVDGADEMNRNAANALLKLLEEPPGRSLLLLVCHAPGQLLPTIRSRCRRLDLPPLGEEDLARLLAARCPALDAEDRALLVRLAEGSIGRALDLAAEGGAELQRIIGGMLAALPRSDTAALHALGDRMGRSGGEALFRTATVLLQGWLARLIRLGAAAPLPEVAPGEAAAMRRLLAAGSLDQWLSLWEKTQRLVAQTDAVNLDRKHVWLTLLLDIEAVARG
ncbi:MAG: DNA polymerase III subunit delta' [Dongiaceae bacterium]